FTGQRILTWETPETKETKTPTPYCEQGLDSNPGNLELNLTIFLFCLSYKSIRSLLCVMYILLHVLQTVLKVL
ncbi:hypothetical protein XENORESO_005868, partial [Xenotaenia resolanae]